MKELHNFILFAVIVFLVYLIFRKFNYNNSNTFMEGMTSNNDSESSSSSLLSSDGIAGNAATYSASLKAATIKLQDILLIKKYRVDYESSILNLDDLINNLMLQSALKANHKNPIDAIENLAKMQQAKVALNSVMKFVDGGG